MRIARIRCPSARSRTTASRVSDVLIPAEHIHQESLECRCARILVELDGRELGDQILTAVIEKLTNSSMDTAVGESLGVADVGSVASLAFDLTDEVFDGVNLEAPENFDARVEFVTDAGSAQ